MLAKTLQIRGDMSNNKNINRDNKSNISNLNDDSSSISSNSDGNLNEIWDNELSSPKDRSFIGDDYIQALSYSELDSSAFILIVSNLITTAIKDDQNVQREIEEVYRSYIYHNYDEAIAKLTVILENNKDKISKDLHAQIDAAKSVIAINDKSEKDTTRRAFDTFVSYSIYADLEKRLPEVTLVVSEFAKHMATRMPNVVNTAPDLTLVDDKGKLIDAEYLKPIDVNNIQELDDVKKVLGIVRFVVSASHKAEQRPREGGIDFIKVGQALEEGTVYKNKDRGEKKIDHVKYKSSVGQQPVTLSSAPGILKARDPLPVEWTTSEVGKDKPVDIREIDLSVRDGFSATKSNIPFTNSISGTTYEFCAVMIDFLKEQKKAGKDINTLQQNAQILTEAFLSFTCERGYHSLGEMIPVLRSKNVLAEFNELGIKPPELTINDHYKAKNMFQVADYAKNLALRQQTVLVLTPTKSDYDDLDVKKGHDYVKKLESELAARREAKAKELESRKANPPVLKKSSRSLNGEKSARW